MASSLTVTACDTYAGALTSGTDHSVFIEEGCGFRADHASSDDANVVSVGSRTFVSREVCFVRNGFQTCGPDRKGIRRRTTTKVVVACVLDTDAYLMGLCKLQGC